MAPQDAASVPGSTGLVGVTAQSEPFAQPEGAPRLGPAGLPLGKRSDLGSTIRLCAMVIILLGSFALRSSRWGRDRFLEDEALYAVWGLQITTGADPMLDHEPVDKPPLFPYALALSLRVLGVPSEESWSPLPVEAAARLPSLIASLSGVALIYAIGCRVFRSASTGLLAATLLALSPFDILFSTTAFTDPAMTAFGLASILAAVSARWGLAGLLLGLAAATKQQGLFFLPLVIAMGLATQRQAVHREPPWRSERSRPGRTAPLSLLARKLLRSHSLRFLCGFLLVAAVVLWWDVSRLQRPGYLEQGLLSYGDLQWASAGALAGRGHAWLRWLSYFWASPWSWALLTATMTAWLLLAVTRGRHTRTIFKGSAYPSAADLALALFIAGVMLLHWFVGFQTWDRYLLVLVPLLALLFARAASGLPALAASPRMNTVASVVLSLLIVATMLSPGLAAARSQLPPGGDHGAYDGIEALADHVRTQVPAGAVLYHFWLGYHYRFYLYGAPLRLHWYPDLEDLVEDATVYRREARYIGFPSWRDSAPAQNALATAGIRLNLAFEAARRDDTPSFRLFKLEGP